MHARQDPPPALRSLAVAQAGVVSIEQAVGHDLTRASVKRLVDQGSWQRLSRGVFLLGVGEPTWLAQAWAGTLLGGHHSWLGFAAAGHVWGLVPEPPEEIRVLVPWRTVREDRGPWTFPRERPGVRQQRSPGDPPRTTVEDTVLDLSCEIPSDKLVGIVTTAVQTRKTDATKLLAAARQRPRLTQRQLLLDLLADVCEGAESPLEVSYRRDVELRHGLPAAERQYRSSRHRAVRDLRDEAYLLLIELDGRTHVSGRFRDMQRDNAALLDGELTLRYGWPDVTNRPCQVAWQVARLLSLRGWSGLPVRCTWCSSAQELDLLGL